MRSAMTPGTNWNGSRSAEQTIDASALAPTDLVSLEAEETTPVVANRAVDFD